MHRNRELNTETPHDDAPDWQAVGAEIAAACTIADAATRLEADALDAFVADAAAGGPCAGAVEMVLDQAERLRELARWLERTGEALSVAAALYIDARAAA